MAQQRDGQSDNPFHKHKRRMDEPQEQYEERVERQFDAFCKTVIDREIKHAWREEKRRRGKQVLFSEMEEGALLALEDPRAARDFDALESEVLVLSYTVMVRDDRLGEALRRLDERARNVILLAYWLDMNDLEIGREIGLPRRTVCYVRHGAQKRLKQILGGMGYGARNFFGGAVD